VYSFLQHGHTAKPEIQEVAEVLVVIARNIDEFCTLSCLAKKFLDDVIVKLVPVPFLAQGPVVDEISNNIKLIRFGSPEKIEKCCRLSPPCAKMNVGYEYGTIVLRRNRKGQHFQALFGLLS
jgi:hypothetical protein